MIAKVFIAITAVEIVAGMLIAQTPLDPGWGAFLRDGGAVAAILFQTAAFVWVLKWILESQATAMKEVREGFIKTIQDIEKANRRAIEKADKRWENADRDSNIAILENTAMLSRVVPVIELISYKEGEHFKPDQSLIVQRKRIGAKIGEMQAAKEQSLKEDEINARVLDEDSND